MGESASVRPITIQFQFLRKCGISYESGLGVRSEEVYRVKYEGGKESTRMSSDQVRKTFLVSLELGEGVVNDSSGVEW